MNKNTISYIVIGVLSLIYLFIFSSTLLNFTSFQNKVVFNLSSTVAIYFLLLIIYQLYFEKVQLTTYELIYVLAIYVIIFTFFTFSKQQIIKEPTINFDVLPVYFKIPSYLNYVYMIWNLIIFLPLGFFYQRYNFKFNYFAIIGFSVVLAYITYISGYNNFSLSDIIIHIIGFYIGFIYGRINKSRSLQWNNLSYDVRLNFTLIISSLMILSLIYPVLP